MQLLFCASESAFSYFAAMRDYLATHGKPVALYSDKAGVFRNNRKEPKGGTGVTQFSRALNSLNIDIVCANTPAAKGRVERAHLTLQDRLVKELRLRAISDVDAANAYAPVFLADYNRRFARAPRSEHDAHRPLLPSNDLDRIFSWQETRRVSKSLTLNYKRVLYVLDPSEAARAAGGQRVGIEEREDGAPHVLAGRPRVGRDGLPERAWRPAGDRRREQATLGDAGDHQDTTASARGRGDRQADDDLTKGPPAACRRAATDRDGGVRRGRPVSECTGHAEATREPTETSGVAETRGAWKLLSCGHRSALPTGLGTPADRCSTSSHTHHSRESVLQMVTHTTRESGHFYFGEKWTFLLWSDTAAARSAPGSVGAVFVPGRRVLNHSSDELAQQLVLCLDQLQQLLPYGSRCGSPQLGRLHSCLPPSVGRLVPRDRPLRPCFALTDRAARV